MYKAVWKSFPKSLSQALSTVNNLKMMMSFAPAKSSAGEARFMHSHLPAYPDVPQIMQRKMGRRKGFARRFSHSHNAIRFALVFNAKGLRRRQQSHSNITLICIRTAFLLRPNAVNRDYRWTRVPQVWSTGSSTGLMARKYEVKLKDYRLCATVKAAVLALTSKDCQNSSKLFCLKRLKRKIIPLQILIGSKMK